MEAGYELDKAVADAIGHCFEETTDCVWESGEKPHGSHWNFHPSTDVNDANLAWKRSGCHGRYDGTVAFICCFDGFAGGTWWKCVIMRGPNLPGYDFEEVADANELCLCMSLAILKLKGKS